MASKLPIAKKLSVVQAVQRATRGKTYGSGLYNKSVSSSVRKSSLRKTTAGLARLSRHLKNHGSPNQIHKL